MTCFLFIIVIIVIIIVIIVIIITIIVIIIIINIWWRISYKFQAVVTSISTSPRAACMNKTYCLDDKIALFTVHLPEVGFSNHDWINPVSTEILIFPLWLCWDKSYYYIVYFSFIILNRRRSSYKQSTQALTYSGVGIWFTYSGAAIWFTYSGVDFSFT